MYAMYHLSENATLSFFKNNLVENELIFMKLLHRIVTKFVSCSACAFADKTSPHSHAQVFHWIQIVFVIWIFACGRSLLIVYN